MKKKNCMFLSDAQLKAEMEKCEYCAEKPCKAACPADCSPADFIMAAKVGEKQDFRRAAALILGNNPLGGVCGAVCPEKHCMQACSRALFDKPVNIPAVQATIVSKARELGALPQFEKARPNGKKIAVLGAGPAGLAAAAVLAQLGYAVALYEGRKRSGGMCALIADARLDKKVLSHDIEFIKTLGGIEFISGTMPDIAGLRARYDAVIAASGLDTPFALGIPGENLAVNWVDYLEQPAAYKLKGKRVAIIGGGAVAADCAETAAQHGAAAIELFCLETLSEMPLNRPELDGLMHCGAAISGRTKIVKILASGKKITGLRTARVELPKGKKFSPREVRDVKGSGRERKGFDFVITAIGARASLKIPSGKGVFAAGDILNGPTTVVEAAASGKNAALKADAFVRGETAPRPAKNVKSAVTLAGRKLLPVPVNSDFFGRKTISPFLLSAAPPTDGYEQMRLAYEAGWAGGIMKTAFDNLPIHIPSEYMFLFGKGTYANCDNVSGHHLERVCREAERLIKEYPDRLTMASTGGPVTGNSESDKRGWQSNTKKLENAGVMGIEYSLSCPQGGDGTKGDIVSQDAELTARIIDWVMEAGDASVPKLFKLTAAVTAIYPIVAAIKEVFAKYPGKKAGITLANTFPTLAFRQGGKPEWEEGVVVGMSGEGVIPISNLTLANVSKMGVHVSGNGGPMDYKSAAHFLALGAQTVQFCTIVMKNGYGIIAELDSGLSHLMQERGIKSVRELRGRALPNPIRGFMELSPVKKISAVREELCEHCGNCARCSYLAITLNGKKIPETDAAKCVGCSICVQKCFAGALYMRERTQKELKLLKED